MLRPVHTLGFLLLPILATILCTATVSAAEHPQVDCQKGWQRLFNGRDLTGWHCVTSDDEAVDPDAWVVEDGALTRKKKGYLRTNAAYDDFILDLEFKVGPPDEKGRRTNSGILLRHRTDPTLVRERKKYWHNGLLEVQIYDSYGLQPDMHACGALYDMVAPGGNPAKQPGQWNRITITADGPAITIILNGEKIVACDLDDWTEANRNPDGTPNKYHKPMKDLASRSGYIWLQDHPGEVWFRNVYLKALD